MRDEMAELHEPDGDANSLAVRRSRPMVATVAALIALAAISCAVGLAGQRGVAAWEPGLFGVGGLMFLVLALAALRRWLAVDTAARLIVGLMTALVSVRLLTLYFGAAYADPQAGIFLPVHATLPVLSLLFVVLLPFPASIRLATTVWVAQAALVTATLWPFLGEAQPRPYLYGTLLFVWLSMAIYLALLAIWTRQQRWLVDGHARMANAAEVARDERARSEARLRLIFEQGTAGIGLIDAEARWLEVNAQLARMLGHTPEELLGHTLCELLPEAGRSERKAYVLAFLGDSSRAVVELRDEGIWMHRDGHPVWMSRHIRRVDNDPGQPARAVVIAIDISDRVRAEAANAEHQRRQDFQFEHLPMAMIEWDRELRVRSWSKQAEALLGWPAEAVIGLTLREAGVLDADEAETHETVMGEFLSGQRIAIESLRQTRCRDGSRVWCRWYSHSMTGVDGRPEFFFTAGLDVTELLENNLRLDASRKELGAIFEQAGVGIAMLDENGRWLTANRRLCDIVGRSEAELLVTDFQTLTHPDDLELDLIQSRQVAAGEISGYAMEKRYIKPDGVVVWARLHVGRIDATALTPMRYVSVIEDIGELKRAEQDVLEHQRVRDFHFENTPLAAIEWTPDLRVKRWSKRAEQIYGWSEAELLGRAVPEWRFIHDDDRAETGAQIDAMLNGSGSSAQIHNRNYHKDGRTLWCQWHNSVLRDDSGAVVSVFSLVKDVSDEQFTVNALRDSQARFQSIFEQSAVGNVMIDAHGNWLMVNQRFREMVGYDAEELLQHNCEEITDAKDRAAEALLRNRLIAREIDDYSFDKRYRRRDGKPVWVSVYARRLDDRDTAGLQASEIRLSLVVVDITERRKAEAEIRKLNADLEGRVAMRTSQLNDTVRHWAQRNQELRILGEMMALLPAARDLNESSRIIESYLPQIFSRCGGAVWLEDTTPQRMSLLGNWGRVQKAPLSLSHDDCWGIRRGQTLRVEDPADPLLCPHLHGNLDGGQQRPHACVPVVALGDTVGLIHLEWIERLDATESPPDPVLIRNVAEQVGLAIGNVRLREELRRQAIRDPLTGLYNRRHFDETLKNRIAEHARNGRGFSLLMIDIDHFKRINDDHGHDIGDEVLRETAGLLARTVRSEEAAFRLGGEEFVMIVDDGEPGGGGQAAGCAERVRREIEVMRVTRRDRVLPAITVSIGLARYPKDVPQGASPLQRADAALYTAKRTGRNRVCTAGVVVGHEGVTGLVKS